MALIGGGAHDAQALAGVTDAVVISVALVRIENRPAVVAAIGNAITIGVGGAGARSSSWVAGLSA